MSALTDADRADLVRRHLWACTRAHATGAPYTLTPGQVARAEALGVTVPTWLDIAETRPWWELPSERAGMPVDSDAIGSF